MKKKFKLLLFIMFLLVPGLTFADMGPPSNVELDGKVINENGAVVYNYKSGNKYEKTDKVIEYEKK